MDFKIAQETKQEIGDIYITEGIQFKVFITPERSEDFHEYCDNFDMDSFGDNSAISFCKNGSYEIRALRIENGVIKWEYPELQQL